MVILINYNAFLVILHAQHASERSKTSVLLARINFISNLSNVLRPVLMDIIPTKEYVNYAILLVSLALGMLLNSAFLVKEIYFCTKTNALKGALFPFFQIRMFKNAKSVLLGAISALVKNHLHAKYVLASIIYLMGFA